MAMIVAMCIGALCLQAQDAFFTQAFNVPLSLNPAMAGNAEMDLRFSAAFKRHWINIPTAMQFASVGVDRFIRPLHGGVGLTVSNSKEGYLNKTSIAAIYSYMLCLPNARLHLGLQAGAGNRGVNYNKLYFSDHIDNTGVIPGAISAADRPLNNNRWFADFGAGFLLYYSDFLMIGGGAQHINQPDESLTGNTISKLPRRWFAHIRYRKNLDEDGERYLLFSNISYIQQKSSSMAWGIEYKDARVGIGAWYRGNVNFQNSDAFCVTVSFDLFDRRYVPDQRMRIGIGYDATTSKLGFTRSAGSAEGVFVWEKLTPKGVHSDERCDADYTMKGTPCPQRF
jgi:type IX secretion system PorP/SprF family membrane protein